MPRYEMLWDCPRCDTKGLLGLSHRHCPSCGAAQDPSARYFPPDDQKVAVEDHPFHGRDVRCAACDSPNARIAAHCVNCGAPLAAAAAVPLVGEAPSPPARSAPAPGKAFRWRPWLVGAAAVGGLALFACLGLLGVEVFGRRPVTLSVVGQTWERTVAVEQHQAVTESAWRSGVPLGARDLGCREEQRSTRRVPDGEDCHTVRTDHGDGTFSESEECRPRFREEPVYDDKCTYTVDRWVVVRTERSTGTTDRPAWPEPAVGGSGLGANRAGARGATYSAVLTDGTSQWTCPIAEATWGRMTPGTRWSTRLGGLSGEPDCEALTSPP